MGDNVKFTSASHCKSSHLVTVRMTKCQAYKIIFKRREVKICSLKKKMEGGDIGMGEKELIRFIFTIRDFRNMFWGLSCQFQDFNRCNADSKREGIVQRQRESIDNSKEVQTDSELCEQRNEQGEVGSGQMSVMAPETRQNPQLFRRLRSQTLEGPDTLHPSHFCLPIFSPYSELTASPALSPLAGWCLPRPIPSSRGGNVSFSPSFAHCQ